MGLIPQSFIDDLIARTDVVELINARVPLKKAGKNYQACCPFHNEKSPSFTVSPQKQFYHCFGCGANGSALGFLMEFDRLEFVDAIEELAKQHGLDVPREGGNTARGPSLKPLHELLDQASTYYQQQLRETPHAIAYLKQRGIDGSTAKAFGIGYAPNAWDSLLKTIGSAQEKGLITSGMLIEKDQSQGKRGSYDRFRDRIMFPIHNTRGNVIGFGGRVLGDEKPKYLNSPETPLFNKGKELYGLYQVRQSLREIQQLLVVEGYMDVIALAQHGIAYAVATLGTALTEDHLTPLFRNSNEVVFCFDGDDAGRRAAQKAMQVCLPEMRDGRQVKFLFLADGEDPDSLVRQLGQSGFEHTLKQQAKPLSVFLTETLSAGIQLNSIDGRAQLVEAARPWLAQIPKGVFRNLLAEDLAQRAKVAVIELLRNNPAATSSNGPKQRQPIRRQSGKLSLTQRALAILLQNPEAAHGLPLPDNIADSDEPGLQVLAVLHARAAIQKMNTAQLLESMRSNARYHQRLSQLMAQTESLAANADEYAQALERINTDLSQQQLRPQQELARKAPSQLNDEEKQLLRQQLARRAQLQQPK